MFESVDGFEVDVSEADYVPVREVPLGFRTMIAPVLAELDDGSLECRGSCFCVISPTGHAQAAFASARHVVDPRTERYPFVPSLLLPKAAIDDGGPDLIQVPIDVISVAPEPNDVALVRVDLSRTEFEVEQDLLSPRIALRPPNEAEHTLAWGYPVQRIADSGAFESELRATHGTVEEVHDDTQDTFSLTTAPSFRATGRHEWGMSGGPVFDEANGVIGVVSRGMTPIDGSPPYGIIQSIGLLAELSLELRTDDGAEFQYSVPQLSQIGLLTLSGDRSVTFRRDDTGLHVRWTP